MFLGVSFIEISCLLFTPTNFVCLGSLACLCIVTLTSDRCPRSVLRPSKLTVAAIRVLSHWVQQIRHLWLATASRLRVHRSQCRCAHSRLERLACGVRWGTKALTSAAARFSFTACPFFGLQILESEVFQLRSALCGLVHRCTVRGGVFSYGPTDTDNDPL